MLRKNSEQTSNNVDNEVGLIKKSISQSLVILAKAADPRLNQPHFLQYRKSENKIRVKGDVKALTAFSDLLKKYEIMLTLNLTDECWLKLDEPVDQNLAKKLSNAAAQVSLQSNLPLVSGSSSSKTLSECKTVPHSGLASLFQTGSLEKLKAYVKRNEAHTIKPDVLDRIIEGFVRLNATDQANFKDFINQRYQALSSSSQMTTPTSFSNPLIKGIFFFVSLILLEQCRTDDLLTMRNLGIMVLVFGLCRVIIRANPEEGQPYYPTIFNKIAAKKLTSIKELNGPSVQLN